MVEKQQPDDRRVVLVKFRLPQEVAADSAYVVGEFNDWSTSANAMNREDGGFVASIPLEAGRAYRFRYFLDGERWENDWAADAYVPNEFGGDDSVIDLTALEAERPPVKPKRPRKAAAATAEKATRKRGAKDN